MLNVSVNHRVFVIRTGALRYKSEGRGFDCSFSLT